MQHFSPITPITAETVNYYRQHYQEYFDTEHWKTLNENLIDSNPDASCWICKKKYTLLIHHVDYQNLFREKLGRDIYILCYDCHTRTHFTTWGFKIPLEKSKLLARMKYLKYTYRIRSFRFGSWINGIWFRMS